MLCIAGTLIKGCFEPVLAVKSRLHRALNPISVRWLCYADEYYKTETSAHGCHYLGDMAVRMPDRGLVFECVTCFYCLKGVTFVVDCVECVPIPVKKKPG